MPFYPFFGEGSPTKTDYREKGTLILTSLLENPDDVKITEVFVKPVFGAIPFAQVASSTPPTDEPQSARSRRACCRQSSALPRRAPRVARTVLGRKRRLRLF